MSTELYGTAFFKGRSPLVRQSAEAVVPHIMDLVRPRSVVDFGCGKGEWLYAFPLDDIFGYDIAAPIHHMYFKRCDLTVPIDARREWDLALCLEVGEHLPEESADTLVKTLVHHSGDIVFGAAVPGQEGIGHINCQPHEYWHEKFAAQGFAMRDEIRPLIANDMLVSPWYRNNMFWYRGVPR